MSTEGGRMGPGGSGSNPEPARGCPSWEKWHGAQGVGHMVAPGAKGLLFCGQVAPVSTGPWPALRSLLHRNLVYRTHQPARWGQLQAVQDRVVGGGSCMMF